MGVLSFSRLFKNLNKIKKIALEFEHMYIMYSVLYRIWPNSPKWLFFDKIDPSLTSNDFLWPDLTSNYLEFKFLTKFWVNTYVYSIQLDQIARFVLFWHVWPKFDLWWFLWPNLTWNNFEFQSWYNNIMSRNISIFDIFRPTCPIWPLLDGYDTSSTSDDPNWPWKIWNLNCWENS